MWHRHQWQTVIQSFSPGRAAGKATGDADFLLALRYGLTTITQRCSTCGLARSYTVPGDGRMTEPKGPETPDWHVRLPVGMQPPPDH